MKKIFATAIIAASVAATPAMAAKQINTEITLNQTAPKVWTGLFGNTVNNIPNDDPALSNVDVDSNLFYTDTYQFTVPTVGMVGASAITLTFDGSLTFTEVLLNGVNLAISQTNGVYLATSPLGGQFSAANPQTLSIKGRLTGETGTYTGNVRFESAVPEPGTWALMILGFGIVGYAMRRRPSVRFAQAI